MLRSVSGLVMLAAVGCGEGSHRSGVLPSVAIAAHSAGHATARAELERFEDQACAGVSRGVRAACPFLEPVALKVIPRGVRLHVDPSQADAIAARMRCHLAFAGARRFERIVECPLYLPGVQIVLAEDRDAIDVTSDHPDVARELVARAFEVYGR